MRFLGVTPHDWKGFLFLMVGYLVVFLVIYFIDKKMEKKTAPLMKTFAAPIGMFLAVVAALFIGWNLPHEFLGFSGSSSKTAGARIMQVISIAVLVPMAIRARNIITVLIIIGVPILAAGNAWIWLTQ